MRLNNKVDKEVDERKLNCKIKKKIIFYRINRKVSTSYADQANQNSEKTAIIFRCIAVIKLGWLHLLTPTELRL